MDVGDVREQHKFDETRLDNYLNSHLNGYPRLGNEKLTTRQYRHVFFFCEYIYLNCKKSCEHSYLVMFWYQYLW